MHRISKKATHAPYRRLRGMLLGAAMGAAALLAGTSHGAMAQSNAAYSGKITYWFWGESDIPGIDNWLTGRVAAYEKLHPGVKINIVPQSSDTLIGAFRLAGSEQVRSRHGYAMGDPADAVALLER